MPKRITRLLLTLLISINAQLLFADSFESNGVKIAFSVQGKGEPVVLIHSFSGSAIDDYGTPGFIKKLAENYQVIAINARGHGASGKPHETTAYGNQMVIDVINLLDHLNIEKANFVGYSMGGYITQQLVTKYSSRVLKAVIASAGWSTPESFRTRFNILAESLESGNGMTSFLAAMTAKEQPAYSYDQINKLNSVLMEINDPLALAAVARAFSQLVGVTEDSLRTNKVPLLFVVGQLDSEKINVDHMREVVSNAQFIEIVGVAHVGIHGHPLFLKAIVTFLSHNANE